MRRASISFVDAATGYLAERRALGFALTITGRRLLAFARYADTHHANGPLTIAMAVGWARQTTRPSPITWARRLEVVRPFAELSARTFWIFQRELSSPRRRSHVDGRPHASRS